MRSIHTPESIIADLNAARDAVDAARGDDAALTAAFKALRRAKTWLRAHNDAEVQAAYDRLMHKASYEDTGPVGLA